MGVIINPFVRLGIAAGGTMNLVLNFKDTGRDIYVYRDGRSFFASNQVIVIIPLATCFTGEEGREDEGSANEDGRVGGALKGSRPTGIRYFFGLLFRHGGIHRQERRDNGIG